MKTAKVPSLSPGQGNLLQTSYAADALTTRPRTSNRPLDHTTIKSNLFTQLGSTKIDCMVKVNSQFYEESAFFPLTH